MKLNLNEREREVHAEIGKTPPQSPCEHGVLPGICHSKQFPSPADELFVLPPSDDDRIEAVKSPRILLANGLGSDQLLLARLMPLAKRKGT